MQNRTQLIRQVARKLLSEQIVECVAGFAAGTAPLRDRPFFAYTPQDADELIWSSFCTTNLATILPRDKKVAVVAQGCVSRNLVGLLQENQLKRDNLHILGLPCVGMVDRRKVWNTAEGNIILEVIEGRDQLLIKGRDFEKSIVRQEMLRDNCFTCIQRVPVLYDVMLTEADQQKGPGDIERVADPWEKLEPAARWEQFQETFKDCIRCYACRDACPLCYCTTCFVDESGPQWCGKTQDDADVQTFHILRAHHCAGRCTDCGACESACPQNIKMRRLTSKIEKDIRTLYDYKPGMDPEATPPMSLYRPNDPQDFVL